MKVIYSAETGNSGALRNFVERVCTNTPNPKFENITILPGVTNTNVFDFSKLKIEMQVNLSAKRTAVVAICGGFHCLFARLYEADCFGLNFFNSEVKPLVDENRLLCNTGFKKCSDGNFYFFNHQYFVDKNTFQIPENLKIKNLITLGNILVGIETENILATQFHPELSGSAGRKLLSQFLRG